MERQIISADRKIKTGMSRTERIVVEMESGEELILPKRIFYRYRIGHLAEIDDELYSQILESLYKFELAYSMRWLGAAERSESQLRNRLLERKVPNGTIIQIIEYLKNQNYLSDVRAAEALLRSLISKGYGPYKMKVKFYEKGLKWSPELLRDTDINALCRSQYDKYITRSREKDRNKRHQLALNYLTRRGFSYDTVREIMSDE